MHLRPLVRAAGVSAAFSADPSLFSADRFHPSGAGHAVIAAALAPAAAHDAVAVAADL